MTLVPMTLVNETTTWQGEFVTVFIALLFAVVALVVIVLAWRARTDILNFWNAVYASWTRISKFGKHLILAVGLTVIFALFGLGCGLYASSQARAWLCQYDRQTYPDCPDLLEISLNVESATPATPPAEQASPSPMPNQGAVPAETPSTAVPSGSPAATPPPTATPTATPTPPLTAEQKERLAAQSRKVGGLIRHHASVMAFFSQAYYTAICVMLFAGAVLAISMFFVGTKGWGQTNEYVRTVFVVMAATVAFYGLWPPVFQQDKNLSDNKALFLEYQTLQNELSSYPVTRTNVKNEIKQPNDFINYVDSEMARLGNVAVGFDYTKITYKGAFESSSSSAPTPTPTPTSTRKPGGAK